MILKNFLNFVKNNRLLFVLLVMTQVIAVVIILFSFGIYKTNKYKLAEDESKGKNLEFSFGNGAVIEVSRIRDKIVEVSKKYENLIEGTYVNSNISLTGYSPEDFKSMGFVESGTNTAVARSEFGVVNGRLSFSKAYNETVLPGLDDEGRGFTEAELADGSKVCLAPRQAYDMQGQQWEINGISYEVVGHEAKSSGRYDNSWRAFEIPVMSLPGDAELNLVSFNLKRPLLRSEYEAIKAEFIPQIISENEVDVSGFYSMEIDEKSTMATMVAMSVFMSLISAFSVCLIYRYMLTKRVKTTAIYRICGGTRLRSSLVYVGEVLLILTASCVAGSLLFGLLIEPLLEKKYIWFSAIYKNVSCYLLVLLYFIIVCGITSAMIAVSNRSTPKELLNGRMK